MGQRQLCRFARTKTINSCTNTAHVSYAPSKCFGTKEIPALDMVPLLQKKIRVLQLSSLVPFSLLCSWCLETRSKFPRVGILEAVKLKGKGKAFFFFSRIPQSKKFWTRVKE